MSGTRFTVSPPFARQLAQLLGQCRHAREVIAIALAVERAEVAQLERLQLALGLLQTTLVSLELLVDEGARLLGVTLLGPDIGFDEQRHQVLHQQLCALAVGVAVREAVDVVAPRTHDLDLLHQRIDHLVDVTRALACQIEVGLLDQLFDVGPRDQRAKQQRHGLVDVEIHGEIAHQRAQHGLGVEIDARRGLVLVGDARHDHGGQGADDPRRQQAIPPLVPHAMQRRGDVIQQFLHGINAV
jgi:hypothetical protein